MKFIVCAAMAFLSSTVLARAETATDTVAFMIFGAGQDVNMDNGKTIHWTKFGDGTFTWKFSNNKSEGSVKIEATDECQYQTTYSMKGSNPVFFTLDFSAAKDPVPERSEKYPGAAFIDWKGVRVCPDGGLECADFEMVKSLTMTLDRYVARRLKAFEYFKANYCAGSGF